MTVLRQTERAFQDALVEYAQLRGYRCAHFRRALNKRGTHMTAVAYDAAGFPDLVMVGNGRVIFAELKSESGRLTPDQRLWLATLHEAGAEAFVWTPADWPLIEETL